MAQIPYRANLSSATWALSLEKAGRTIINPGVDQNFDRRVDPSGDTSKAVGIPQAIFMENVLPTYEGYQSVGYKGAQDITVAGTTTVNHVVHLPVIDDSGGGALAVPKEWVIKITYDSEDIYYSEGYDEAESLVNVPGFGFDTTPSFSPISTVFVQGRSFIYDGTNIWEVTNTAAGVLTFTNVTGSLSGLGGLVVKFVTVFNYLIAIDITGLVSWSSLTNPLDFTASLVTGAGSTTPTSLNSPIVTMLEHPQGFIIYTETNAIAARYTGNKAYPWRMYEIESSAGINIWYDVAGGVNSAAHFQKTTSGNICAVTMEKSDIIIPDVSDYLQTSRIYTEYDSELATFSLQEFPADSYGYQKYGDPFGTEQLASRIACLNDRYLLISYGRAISAPAVSSVLAGIFDFVFVFDLLLLRLGKFKLTHTHVDAYGGNLYLIAGYGSTLYSPDSGIAWQIYHNILEQDFPGEGNPSYHRGVLAVGKFQYIRPNNLILEGIDLEITLPEPAFNNTTPGTDDYFNFQLYHFYSYDGFNFANSGFGVAPYQRSRTTYQIKYLAHTEALNHVIVVQGAFSVNTLLLTFSLGGKPFV